MQDFLVQVVLVFLAWGIYKTDKVLTAVAKLEGAVFGNGHGESRGMKADVEDLRERVGRIEKSHYMA